jgi:NCAIR mutase (PurE)-related protein
MPDIMDRSRLETLLHQVRDGTLPVAEALAALRDFPLRELGFAHVDTHRELRTGFAEVILAEHKTREEVLAIAREILAGSDRLLVTRTPPATARALLDAYPEAIHGERGRTVRVQRGAPPEPRGLVLVVTAGTSDLPVAEEALATLQIMGNRAELLADVGVAGVHRIMHARERLQAARALIVVAGMEGALASVVGGLVACPVVAVPTSVGYGASFGGLAALLGMLNACAPGVSVVNIDNGFGAACVASRVNLGQPV